MGVEHSFNIELAKRFGIEEAIIINNLFFWIRKNEANEKHFHNGRYWTYNTNKALSELFPYISESKIFRVLKHLEDEGIIVKGNYNEKKMDRTCWYSFTDKGLLLLNYQFQNDNMHISNMENAYSQNEVTIPYSKHTDINKEDKDKSLSKKDDNDDAFIDKIYAMYPTKCPKRNAYLGKSHADKKRIAKLLKQYSKEEIEMVVNYEIQTKYGKNYMFNFSTFLNNFPDPSCLDIPKYKVESDDSSKEIKDGVKNSKGEIWSEQLHKWLK